MIGSGEEEDDGGLTPTEDDDDIQRLSLLAGKRVCPCLPRV